MESISVMTVFTDVELSEGMSCGSAYKRYLVAAREGLPNAIADQSEASGSVRPSFMAFRNARPLAPRDSLGARLLANLLWQDALGVSEIWWFANLAEQVHPTFSIPTTVRTRTVNMKNLRPGPLLLARLRSVSEVEALIGQIGPWLMCCNWLALGHIGDGVFDSIELDPDTQLCLDMDIPLMEDLPRVFRGADLTPYWRYVATQDFFRYDSGDPFFTLQGSSTEFEQSLRAQALRDERFYYQLPYTQNTYMSFIRDGVIIVPAMTTIGG